MSAPLGPRETGKFITENSKDVTVDMEGVRSLAEKLFQKIDRKELTLKGWKFLHELNPQGSGEDALNWVFFADTLNFSFWSENQDKKYLVKYKGKDYSGYWSFCAAINRALDEGIPITTASYYSDITLDQLKYVFRSDTDVPITMIETRLEILHQTGKILMEKFGGSFLNCVKMSERSAAKLMQLVVENFPSYRDEAVFQGKKVAFYKRAQILVGDTWAVLEGKNEGSFHDIQKITMFADYRVPQTLLHFGVIRYSEEIVKKLKEGLIQTAAIVAIIWPHQLRPDHSHDRNLWLLVTAPSPSWAAARLPIDFSPLQLPLSGPDFGRAHRHLNVPSGWLFQNGDREEMEIRGCSIWAVELIYEHVQELYKKKDGKISNNVNSILLNNFLWDFARDNRKAVDVVPFHRVRCIYY
ncbi:hypothetical protein GDO81_017167 [Engystomops pustulosus]|uniref:Queuosine 5'-phosphate N-glycosylase/hydrolase n=1 Tax=Engystomops pustulosus TaxID=76066 RepID=A0AAV7ABB6_ENGPU|nr:hypothetical protein GDO81_017167 [Engystomops pustulosus]